MGFALPGALAAAPVYPQRKIFLIGLTAPIAIVLGLIAIPVALVGLGRVQCREATNRGVTIAGLALGFLAIALGIFSIVITVQAVGDGLDGPTATVMGASGEAAPEQLVGPVPLGTTLEVDGLAITVHEIVAGSSLGKRVYCANVTYENRGDNHASRNPFDWSACNAQGASVTHWPYSEKNALDSGDLAPGGTDSGLVCFDVPRDEIAVVEYKASLFSDRPDAEWAAP